MLIIDTSKIEIWSSIDRTRLEHISTILYDHELVSVNKAVPFGPMLAGLPGSVDLN